MAAREVQDPVVHELRKISNLLALAAVRDKQKSEAVVLLTAAGFGSQEAAALIGTSDASVRAMLSQARKRTLVKEPDGAP